jgi:leucyl aminopeptidase (aminopeptidase T)
MRRRKGETVEVATPRGTELTFEILETETA